MKEHPLDTLIDLLYDYLYKRQLPTRSRQFPTVVQLQVPADDYHRLQLLRHRLMPSDREQPTMLAGVTHD